MSKKTKIRLSDNVHPEVNGEPWGWLMYADGSRVRIATYSGRDEKKKLQEIVDVYNKAIDNEQS